MFRVNQRVYHKEGLNISKHKEGLNITKHKEGLNITKNYGSKSLLFIHFLPTQN